MENAVNLKGTVTRIIHSSPDDTFHIMSLQASDKTRVTILGSLFGVKENEELEIWGTAEQHKEYGYQIRVTRWEKPMPNTTDQVREFLESSLVKGVGKVTAKRIAEKLGPDALNIILENGPEALHGIRGLSKKNAEKVYNSLHETFDIQRVVMQLNDFGLKPQMAIRAYQHFGSSVVEMIRHNPYCLTEVNLIGFQRADEIAAILGISPQSPYRINAAILYTLEEASAKEGHCFLTIEQLVQRCFKLLNHTGNHVAHLHIYPLIGKDENTVVEGHNIYLKRLYIAECVVGKKIKLLASRPGMRIPPSKIEANIKKYELVNRIKLAPEQRDAVHQIFNTNFLILTGGPGTGKSMTVNAIINVFRFLGNTPKILLAAPTGRASRRLAELTGMDAATIQRMLGVRPGEGVLYNAQNPLDADLVVIDEASMLDISLSKLTFEAISPTTKVLLVGDSDQLPSVGPGNVLRDLIHTDIPSVRLTKIFRQAQESQIVTNAHRVNHGQYITADHSKGDFYFIKRENPADIAKTIVISFARFMQLGYDPHDIQVLTPMKRGEIGTIELNRVLQETINPPSPTKQEITRGHTTFRVGDKVMQIKNNYDKEVFNGEVGTVVGITTVYDADGKATNKKGLLVAFNQDTITYKYDELEQLVLAYAITTHKSQGGEWPIIISPVSTQHYNMLARNLVYTAITRAKQKVALIGTDKALGIAINNNRIAQRNTMLSERITEKALNIAVH